METTIFASSPWRPWSDSSAPTAHPKEAKIAADARYDGKWVLRTNTDLDADAVALQFKRLWMVEHWFRSCKSLLQTRPIYHKCDETIRGHVFCSFLALVLRQELQSRLEERGHDLEGRERALLVGVKGGRVGADDGEQDSPSARPLCRVRHEPGRHRHRRGPDRAALRGDEETFRRSDLFAGAPHVVVGYGDGGSARGADRGEDQVIGIRFGDAQPRRVRVRVLPLFRDRPALLERPDTLAAQAISGAARGQCGQQQDTQSSGKRSQWDTPTARVWRMLSGR